MPAQPTYTSFAAFREDFSAADRATLATQAELMTFADTHALTPMSRAHFSRLVPAIAEVLRKLDDAKVRAGVPRSAVQDDRSVEQIIQDAFDSVNLARGFS